MYDTELMRFSMEKQGLSGLVAEILYTNEEQAHLLPLDMERTGKGVDVYKRQFPHPLRLAQHHK